MGVVRPSAGNDIARRRQVAGRAEECRLLCGIPCDVRTQLVRVPKLVGCGVALSAALEQTPNRFRQESQKMWFGYRRDVVANALRVGRRFAEGSCLPREHGGSHDDIGTGVRRRNGAIK